MTLYEMAACPVCGQQNFRTLADAHEIKRQLEDLWEFHTRRLRAGAPVQQLFDRAVFSQDPPLQIVQCVSCHTVLRAPRESASALVDMYAGEEPPGAALETLFHEQKKFFQPRVWELGELHGKTGSVLEVGSYIGGFLSAATDAGWTAQGIDVNPHTNEFARGKRCSVTASTLEELGDDVRYDVVALWNCLDQLPDARSALTRARSLLQPNGVVALRVPNGACYAAFHKRAGMRSLLAYNNLLSFPYRNGFTLASLEQLLQAVGLQIEVAHGDVLVPIASEWTKSWAKSEERIIKRLARTFLPKKLRPWLEVYARRRDDGAP